MIFFIRGKTLKEKQTPDRHKTSGSKRPILPFNGDWLMTEGVSPELDIPATPAGVSHLTFQSTCLTIG
ncbi:hypothetical protein CUU66_06820 [Peribacillus deserti]|uniref:Uncharacterized protein n=1 Tax=Peribacillus deserti TaxID=673318 RepID=A0A2N5M872_9BACI|nr:hypothetical protein CUU66_06820 [Peribacillus deserti]